MTNLRKNFLVSLKHDKNIKAKSKHNINSRQDLEKFIHSGRSIVCRTDFDASCPLVRSCERAVIGERLVVRFSHGT